MFPNSIMKVIGRVLFNLDDLVVSRGASWQLVVSLVAHEVSSLVHVTWQPSVFCVNAVESFRV